jgi:type III pantothenate kinase
VTLLVVDVGNTRLKWAILDGATGIARGAITTEDAKNISVLVDAWQSYNITHTIVSNVAGAVLCTAIEAALSSRRITPLFIQSTSTACGLRNGYAKPQQLGTDRFAALVAAHHASLSASAHKLVVMAGTALTIDALTIQGDFLGGVIIPGPALMQRALHHGTANLPDDDGKHVAFPQSTPDAIATGAAEAAIGAILRLRARLALQMRVAPDDIVTIGSGGAMQALQPHIPFPIAINDNLVIDGLVALWREAQAQFKLN